MIEHILRAVCFDGNTRALAVQSKDKMMASDESPLSPGAKQKSSDKQGSRDVGNRGSWRQRYLHEHRHASDGVPGGECERPVSVSGCSGGAYELTVSHPGFQNLVQKWIEMLTAHTVDLSFVLRVGQSSESVVVEASAQMLQTSTVTGRSRTRVIQD